MNIENGRSRSFRSDILFAFALALGCYLAWLIRESLVLIYVSALFAVVLNPAVHFIAKIRIRGWQLSKGVAVLLLLLAVGATFGLFVSLALPPVVRDLQEFVREAPTRLPALLEKVKGVPFVKNIDATEMSSRLQDLVTQGASILFFSLRGGVSNLFNLIMGLILVVYFILEGDHAYHWFLSFFPLAHRERLGRTLQRAEMRIGKWLLGQGCLMLILGACSTIVFLCLHVRYAYALGVLAGMLNLIPVAGAAASIVLAALVAAIDSSGAALGVTVFYLVYIQIENSILIPRIMKNSVDLPGLAILIALLIGSALEGILGAMVSIPTAVLVTVLIDEYLVHKEPA